MKSAELDVVVLSEDLPNEGLVKGTLGLLLLWFLIRQQLAIWSSFATRKKNNRNASFIPRPAKALFHDS